MEESVDLLKLVTDTFQIEKQDLATYSPLTLAYIGDSIYDAIIKTMTVEQGNRSAEALHKHVTGLVNAGTQSRMIESLLDELTDEEKEIYRRGRNAKSYTSAKNASISDYRRATGFEALIGYLYLCGKLDRAVLLTRKALVNLEIIKESAIE